MGVMKCENCKHFKQFGDDFNPCSYGRCLKARMTKAGAQFIDVEGYEFCYWFEKKKGAKQNDK